MKKRILVLSHDKTLLEETQQTLGEETNLITITAVSCDAGIELALQLKPHIIIIDAALSGLLDDAVCQRLRRDWETREIPLLLLLDPVANQAVAEVSARRLGADEYLLKSTVSEDLVHKVRAMIRHQRPQSEGNSVFDDGRLYIDFDAYLVRVNGREPKLTLKEFTLLKFLIENPGRVFSRDKLLDIIWGYQRFGKTRTVDVHVRRIRQKLGLGSEEYIQTIISVGYLFKPQDRQVSAPFTKQAGSSPH